MAEYSLASVKSGAPKAYNLKKLIAEGAIIIDPQHPAFQARNSQPLDEEFTSAFKKSGGWSPANPGTLTRFQGKLIVVNGNTRTRVADSLGMEEGYFHEVKLAKEDDVMELHRLRLHENARTESDPWTTAETFAAGEQRGLTPEEQAINVSASTVKKWLQVYHIVMGLGPKAKAEEKPEATAERLKKCKEAQDKAIAKIRTKELTQADIFKFFERGLVGDDFDKAFKALVSKKKAEKVAAATEQQAKTLDEYQDARVPAKFFPDFQVSIVTKSALSEGEKAAAKATLDVVMGLLPLKSFLAGDFTLPVPEPKKGKGAKESDAGVDSEDGVDAEDDEAESAA